MREAQLQESLQILNFKKFHQFLSQLKKNKLSPGKFEPISEKEYVEFVEEQRSLITKDKITKISEKLKTMEVRLFGPDDFDKFVSLQNQTINSHFNGQRTRKREQKLFILDLWSKLLSGIQILKRVIQPELKMQDEVEKLLKIYSPENPNSMFGGSLDFPNLEKTIFINLKAIEVMSSDIKSYGGKLVIVDSTANIIGKGKLPAILISTVLENYCNVNNIGYIPLYKSLDIENSNGNKTRWPHDGHFNELGTQTFAKSMYRWLQNNGASMSLRN